MFIKKGKEQRESAKMTTKGPRSQMNKKIIYFLSYILGVDAWWTNFKGYIGEDKGVSDWRTTLQSNRTEKRFEFLLSEFLHSRQGSKYKRNFHFDGNLTCNAPAPQITVKFSCQKFKCCI